MKETRYGDILNNAVRMAGFDPDVMTVPGRQRVMAELAVNTGLRRLYAEKFPIFKRIEFRRYRPTWTSGGGFSRGMECWWNGSYWRLDAAVGSGAPDSAGSGWTKLEMANVSAFVAFDQPWEQTPMDPCGVDKNNFAYIEDPKYHPNAKPVGGCGWFEEGVLLPAPAPEGVYCRFIPEAPKVTFTEWSNTASYLPGDIVYRASTKDVYRCLYEPEEVGTEPEDDPDNWVSMRVPGIFEMYLTMFAASQIMSEDQGKYQSEAAAAKELEEISDRLLGYAGEAQTVVGSYASRG